MINIPGQIDDYINSQPEMKRFDMELLHKLITKLLPTGKLWYLDGKNSENKIVSNPNIGYGSFNIKYADGTFKEFYQIGMSANKTGISIYILGLEDKTYLPQKFAQKIGKANVSGYCIKFKSLKDIHLNVLEEAISYGINATHKA